MMKETILRCSKTHKKIHSTIHVRFTMKSDVPHVC